jgi:hypothetical protein
MTRRFAAVCLVAACGWASAQESLKPAEIKKLVETLNEARVKGDAAKVIDLTYDGVVKSKGGREAAIQSLKLEMKADINLPASKTTVSDPGPVLTEGANLFTVVPVTLEVKSAAGKLVVKSYVLGVSGDGGKTWKFADATVLGDPQARKTTLPKLPAKLDAPIPSAEIVKE